MMAKLLDRITNLPIVTVSKEMTPKADHIYLIPPAYNLLYKEGQLRPTDKPNNQSLNLPIDLFFEDLAREAKENAIGIILSGTGSDGTRGARAIKENDGMIMVQDPREAQFNGMPHSAINTGLVDYVISAEKMGWELMNFLSSPVILDIEEGAVEKDRSQLMQILKFINQKTGLDFREYNKATLARRVARRVQVCKLPSLKHYLQYLQKHPEEVDILYREFLIGVTRFFRDPQVWDVLRKEVIPELIAKTPNGDSLKIWD